MLLYFSPTESKSLAYSFRGTSFDGQEFCCIKERGKFIGDLITKNSKNLKICWTEFLFTKHSKNTYGLTFGHKRISRKRFQSFLFCPFRISYSRIVYNIIRYCWL